MTGTIEDKAREVLAGWQDIATAPPMVVILLFHEYFSHGRVRHGYRNRKGEWQGVNATGTEGALIFEPTHWMPLPNPPSQSPRKDVVDG